MKTSLTQNVTCALETAVITSIYAAVLFIGAQALINAL